MFFFLSLLRFDQTLEERKSSRVINVNKSIELCSREFSADAEAKRRNLDGRTQEEEKTPQARE